MIIGTAAFRIREGELEAALEAIRSFVAAVADEPGTLVYRSLHDQEDPQRFLHMFEFADEAARDVHASSDAVETFTSVLYPLCEEPVVFAAWEVAAAASR